MKRKGSSRFETKVRAIGDPDTREGMKKLAGRVIGAVIVDGPPPRGEEGLAAYIAETYFGGTLGDAETYARVQAVFDSN
jgi:hypothetical protein